MQDAFLTLCICSYLLGQLHAEEEIPKQINANDTNQIANVPFKEAINFLKAKVPLSKKQFNELDKKLRFRAFTMAKLGLATEIETAKQILIGALQNGESYSQTWEQLKDVLQENASFNAGYWETVFRTNTQSAYTAGKLQKYAGTGVVAYQLMVIEDSRTSHICKHLLKESGYGVALPVTHPFWQKYGFPPYHFNCRTSINPIYKSQLGKTGYTVDNPPLKHFAKFKPQADFGGNPLDKGNWWDMTPSMQKQAIKFGLLDEIKKVKEILIDTGARSKIVNSLDGVDVFKKQEIADKYYSNIRKSDNKDLIARISKHTGINEYEIEKIINHIFKQKHHFMDGRFERFGADSCIVTALERLKTGEYTDIDILFLNHELLELTYMKNKKYNIYEVAHEMANKKYNWQEALNNENV